MTRVLIPASHPTLEDLQSRVLAVLAVALPASEGWRESVYAPRQLGLDGGPGSGQVYSVELPDTDIPETRRQRRGAAYGVEPWQAKTTILVRWVVALPADGQDAGYSGALRTEARIVGALLNGTMVTTNTHEIRVPRTRREIIGDGTHLHGMVYAEIGHAYVIEVDQGS